MGAASYAMYDVVRIQTAVAESDPLAGVPETCGARAGQLTAGGSAKDSDADGIPDDLTITITAANCDTTAYNWVGKIHVSDPGTTPGYDMSAELDHTMTSSVVIHHLDVRHIRYNGATTTGSIDFRESFTSTAFGGGPVSEGSGYSATFTLTPTGAEELGIGSFEPATLAFTGWIDWKDDLPPTSGPWRFSIRSVEPVVIDSHCGDYGAVQGGAFEGKLNGGGPAQFTQTWSGCGASVIATEGTTD